MKTDEFQGIPMKPWKFIKSLFLRDGNSRNRRMHETIWITAPNWWFLSPEPPFSWNSAFSWNSNFPAQNASRAKKYSRARNRTFPPRGVAGMSIWPYVLCFKNTAKLNVQRCLSPLHPPKWWKFVKMVLFRWKSPIFMKMGGKGWKKHFSPPNRPLGADGLKNP